MVSLAFGTVLGRARRSGSLLLVLLLLEVCWQTLGHRRYVGHGRRRQEILAEL